VASRRAAEDLLRAGRVAVNGETARLGQSADPQRDLVTLDGVELGSAPCAYWVVHKPAGVITTARDPEGRRTVLDLLPEAARGLRLFPVGRLDRDSEGLVLLTNDGALAQVLLHPSFETPRAYRVTVRGRVPARALERLARGVELEEGRTAPARVGPARRDPATDTTRFELVVIEGRKRQIRRALALLGHPVVRLLRVRMGPLRLGRLAPGAARELSAGERSALLRLRPRAGVSARASPRRGGRSSRRRGAGRGRSRSGGRRSPAPSVPRRAVPGCPRSAPPGEDLRDRDGWRGAPARR
jgi:23S rRNA pseudouridine2605 synthase